MFVRKSINERRRGLKATLVAKLLSCLCVVLVHACKYVLISVY